MNFIGIIPARYASSRFPGKPLVDIHGKSMIQRVYEQSKKVLENVVVATDDEKIYTAVKSFNGQVVMTSPDHQSGTDRCAEAATIIKKTLHIDFDVVINIQGDEPFIQPGQLKKLMHCFTDNATQIATLIKKVEVNGDIFNPNKPKVIVNKDFEAIYFSRNPIPYVRDVDQNNWHKKYVFYKHIGLYAYRFDILKEITMLGQSPLELSEKLEQNRWIENGYRIKVATTDYESISIDTPEDLEEAKKLL